MNKVIVLEGRRKGDGMPIKIEFDTIVNTHSWSSSRMLGSLNFELTTTDEYEHPSINSLSELEDVRLYLEDA